MLKGKRGVSACSLSSCRIRAEALARAFNSRLWPCAWASNSPTADRDDGMSNGIDDDEEFFDASPSPVEVEDESLFCQQHSSAATEAGRAKLYELLQQHAADDAIDVFYDVSEDAGLADSSKDTCLRNDKKDSVQVDELCESSECCGLVDKGSKFTNGEDHDISDEEKNELKLSVVNQSSGASITDKIQDDIESQKSSEDRYDEYNITNGADHEIDDEKKNEVKLLTANQNCYASITDKIQDDIESIHSNENQDESQTIHNLRDPSTPCSAFSRYNEHGENDELFSDEMRENFINEDNMVLGEKSTSDVQEAENTSKGELVNSDDIKDLLDEIIPENREESTLATEASQVFDLPSEVSNTEAEALDHEENFINTNPECSDNVSKPTRVDKILDISKDNIVSIEIIGTNSPSPTSDKNVSPTSSRLQVFDEPRPKISRTTSLKTGKTPPGTPSKKKIVRFADVLGLDLEDVRHILTGDIPIIPSSAYTDLNLKDVDMPSCEPISETVEIKSRRSPCWNSLQRATATNVLYPVFAIPGEQPDFLDRIRNQGICLETLVVSDTSVQCTCRVMNYGFHKKVLARYTVNNWLSTNDIDALYVQGSSNSETDSFAFSIFLSPTNRNVKFALKYTVNGKEYWDNNRGQNYCLNYHGTDNVQSVPTYSHTTFGELWQHQFW